MVKDWEVDMIFDKPVDKMEIYNAVVDTESGNKFRITPESWNTRFATGDEVTINFKASFKQSEEKPELSSIVVNGKYHDCKPPKKSPTTRISIHPTWPKKVLDKPL